MNRRLLGGLLLGLITIAAGCRDIWGFHEPILISGTGGTGAGGDTGASGGTGGCMSPSDCGPTGNECVVATCEAGLCGTANVADGTVVKDQTLGDCKRVLCDGKGATRTAIDTGDPFDDGKQCTDDKCVGSTPKNDPKAVGTACSGGKCSALGECVECVAPGDCTSGVCGSDGNCLPATCNDKTQNGGETDIDCGGPTCDDCGIGQKCASGTDCVSGVCSGVSLCACAQPACPIWTRAIGSVGDEKLHGIATDNAGNVYFAGEFKNALDFGGGIIPAAGAADIFVVKYDMNGNFVWVRTYGDGSLQIANAIAVDGSGNVLVAGEMAGTVDFGGGALGSHGGVDVFLLSLDSDGNYNWAQRFGEAPNQRALGVAVDGSKNVLITGYFAGDIDFGMGVMTSVGNTDVFVAKFSSLGVPLFQAKFGDSDQQLGYAIAADTSNNFFLAGSFAGTMTMGATTLTGAGAGTSDAYVAKLSPAGNVLWAKSYGDPGFQAASGIALDDQGGPVVVGTFQGTVDFGGGKPPFVAVGLHDAFAVKLNSLGNYQWAKQYGSTGLQLANAVAVDQGNNVILTGSFENAIDFGGGAMTSAGATDLFLAKVSSTGDQVWSLRAGDAANQAGTAVAVDPLGNVIVGGNFGGVVDFGLGPLTSAGNFDIITAKVGP